MTEKELQEHLIAIYEMLDDLRQKVKMLIDEKEQRGIFADMDQQIESFFKGVLK